MNYTPKNYVIHEQFTSGQCSYNLEKVAHQPQHLCVCLPKLPTCKANLLFNITQLLVHRNTLHYNQQRYVPALKIYSEMEGYFSVKLC